MGRVVVLGSSNTDLMLRVQRLPRAGETVLGSDFLVAAGGKGANQAVAAARAGAQVTFLGAVGDDDFGRQARRQLAAQGLDLSYLHVLADRPSGVALILVDEEGGNLIGVGPGANASVDKAVVAEFPAAVFRGPGVFVTQLETPLDAVRAALVRAKAGELSIVFNPAPADPRALEDGLGEIVDVLVVNEHEAAVLAGDGPLANAAAAEKAARRLRQKGPRSVIITLGEAGFLVLDEDRAAAEDGLKVRAVDTVAAGDAFVGALACALSEGRTLLDAARWSNKAAAIACTRRGAQPSLPWRAEIDAQTS